MRPFFLLLALFVSVAILLPAESASAQSVIMVPGDNPTIQGAIDAAAPGDTVLAGDILREHQLPREGDHGGERPGPGSDRHRRQFTRVLPSEGRICNTALIGRLISGLRL
jgi:hypothetical protein